MRLTLKLTLGILLGVALTLLVNSVMSAQRGREQVEKNLKQDHLVLAHALAVDIVEELRVSGEPAALALVQKMNAQRDAVDITAVHASELPLALAHRVDDDGVDQSFEGVGDDERLVTRLALPHTELVLTIAEPMGPANRFAQAAQMRRTITAGVGLGGSALLAFLFGFFLVGRPVRALVDKARRVGDGDLEGPLPTSRSDELGVLAAELNAMCERLAAARSDLVRAADERIAALQQLRQADRVSTLGLLAAGLAHELGTPLNVVAGRARLIAEGGADATKSALLIEEQAQRMTRIVRQLLDFARQRPPHKERVDASALCVDTAEMLGSLAEKRGVTVVVEAPAPAPVDVDRDQLQQAVTNLLVNAVHASAPGQRVRIAIERTSDDGARISVIDEGVGMDEETMKNCFTPFFTTKDVGEGTGLGLAVASGLVEENGGTIRVASEPGTGSIFTIELGSSSSLSLSGRTADAANEHEGTQEKAA